MKLNVLTWNTLFAGRDGQDDKRAKAQIEVINQIKPDIFLMQEARGFDANGGAWLYDFETNIDMRGFLAMAPRTGQHTAIFIRAPLIPVSFDADSTNFHHALATLKVVLPGSVDVITLVSAHLCPNGPAVRRREAVYLSILANPDQLTLLTGDFNSLSPHDFEPEDFNKLAAHHRTRYLGDDLVTVDRTVLSNLEAAGWVDLGYILGFNNVPTVPAAEFNGTEFATMRSDYMMASKALASRAKKYEVICNRLTNMASDHYPVLTSFEI